MFTSSDGVITVDWKISDETIYFTVKGKTSGWVGIGFNANSPQMIDSDVIWGQINTNGSAVVLDAYAPELKQPITDTVQDVFLVPGESGFSNGVTTLSFYRALRTNNSLDVAIPKNSSVWFLWAHSASKGTVDATGNYVYQQHDKADAVQINFGTNLISGNKDVIRKLHGIAMLLAWSLFSVVGIFIARYLKTEMKFWWFYIHIILQVIASGLTIAGFILIVYYYQSHGLKHFDGFHQILGLIVVIVAVGQPFIGWLADKLFDKNRTQVPWFPDKIHWYVGAFLAVFGIINVWIGLSLYCASTTAITFFCVAFLVITITYLVHEIMSWLLPWGDFLRSHSHLDGVPVKQLKLIQGISVLFITGFIIVTAVEIWVSGSESPFYSGCPAGGSLDFKNTVWLAYLVGGVGYMVIFTVAGFAAYYISSRRQDKRKQNIFTEDDDDPRLSLTKNRH